MKINFKKVSSVLASAAMLGATFGLAAAAYPEPLVSGGVSNVAIVYGSSAAQSDYLAAQTVQTNLLASVTTQSIAGQTPSGGESLLLEKSSTKLQTGYGIQDVVATAITEDSPNGGLPTLLADGKYVDNDNDEFDYTQKINLANLQLAMFDDNDYKTDTPTMAIRIANAAHVLNYTMEMTDQPNWDDLSSSDVRLLGKDYYILQTNSSSGSASMDLLDSAQENTLALGESSTITVNGKTYDVSVDFITSSSAVTFTINGDSTNSLSAGQTQRLADGAYVGVKTVYYSSKEADVNKVEFSIGSGKLKLVDGSDIELNDEAISNLAAYITDTSGKLVKIVLQWKADDDLFITPDSQITMPGFGAVKLSFPGMVYPKSETITVSGSSTTVITLEDFPLKGSTEDINILYANSTNYIGIGKDGDNMLRTAPGQTGANITFDGDTDAYFVASWDDGSDAESYLLKATNFKVESLINKTTFQYKKDGVWTSAKEDAQQADVVTIGNLEFTVGFIDKNAKTVNVTAGSNVDFQTLYSKEGMKVWLPFNMTSGETFQLGLGLLNESCTEGGNNSATFNLVFQEENKDDTPAAGRSVNLTLGFNSASTPEVEVDGITGGNATSTEIGDTKEFRDFVYSALGTEILWKKPSSGQNSVKLVYHGGESYGQLYITAPETSFGGSDGAVVILKDSEVANASGKNLVVIGGSCINSVAASVLGVASGTCGPDFTTATSVGDGQYLIATYSYSGKLATVVAGYNAADTTAAANYLTTSTLNIAAGQKLVGPA